MATDPYQMNSGESPFARAERLAREEEKRLEMRRLQETPADAKRRAAAARALNLKPSEIMDVSWAERQIAARRQMELREKYPAIGRAFNQNPPLAGYMLGEEDELETLGGAFKAFLTRAPGERGNALEVVSEFVSNAPGRIANVGGGVVQKWTQSVSQEVQELVLPAFAELNRAQARFTGVEQNIRDADEFAAGVDRWIQEGRRRIAFTEAEMERQRGIYGSDNALTRAALGGLDSVPASILAGISTIATRNPNVGASILGLGVGAEGVQSAKAKGLTGVSAYAYGATQGLSEYVFEKAPMGELLKLGGRGFVSGVGRFLMKEVPGELATTTVQSFTDWAMLPENSDRTFADWASTLPEAWAQTVIGTVVGGGALAGAFKGFDSAGRRLESFARRRAAQREMAAFGKFEGDWLDMMGNAVSGSALRQGDPEAFANLMRDMATERGVSTVLVPGEAVRDYLQSSAFEGENDPLAPYQQAALEAAAAGNDIAIPIETALTVLPGSKAWEALKDDMRLTAGGMSRRQAEALEDSEQAMLEEFRKQAEETDAKAKKQTASREARIAKVKAKLEEDGGFAPVEAERQAELLVARMTTRAARMGRDDQAVDNAVENLRIRQVMPPELQRAMAAQERDMVVAVLRGNTKGATSRARAAAAELQAVLARQGWTPEQLSDEQLGQVIERMASAGENDGREYRAGDGAGRGSGGGADGKYAPLDGATKARGWHGPVRELVDAADEYARRAGIDLKRQAYFITKERFDEEFARRIADAYEAMEHAPNDPAVRAAYEAMIAETRAQYDVLVEFGYSFTFFGNDDDPYAGNPFNAMRDLRDNKTMAVYSTIAGYGSGYSEAAVDDNPLLADTGLEWPDQNGQPVKVLANDLFRAVHDAFGHGLEGAGFRYDGEENAWQAHARLFSPAALPALTSETRGQNSWLNWGPRGDENRFAVLDDTTFADQKAGLLPSWAWTENVVPDMEPTDGRLDEALIDGESAGLAADGSIQIGWSPQRIEDLLRAHGYASEPERSKALAVRISPDQFLGLTASATGRRLIAERVEGMEEYGDGIDFDKMRENPQAPFLIVAVEGGFTNVFGTEVPVTLRVVGHEGRHRMTMLKAAGVTSVPVVVIVQENRGKDIPETANASPQRSRSDQVATGDTEALFENMVPISYANRERLAQEFGQGRELFQESPFSTRYNAEADTYREAINAAWDSWRDWHRRAMAMGADAAGTGPVADLRRIGTPEALALADEGERITNYLKGLETWPVEQVEMFPGEELGDAPDFVIRDDQDTIEIDGIERPTKNADEELIAINKAGLTNFWRWFGDSPLVDEYGRPRVWYHGSRSMTVEDRTMAFRESATNFFASDYRTARDFGAGDNAVFKVYIRAERLAEHDAEGRMWDQVYEPEGYEIDEAMDRYIADQIADWEPTSSIEEKSDGTWRVFDAVNDEYNEFDNEGAARDDYDDAVERERMTFEEELRDDTTWWELQEKEYLSGGRSTDRVAEDDTADGHDVTLITDVDEGSGATDVAIVLSDPRLIKATENIGTFDPEDPRIYLQATWFYSALERAAESVKTERAPAAQWIATLKNAPGVKAEELEWTGIIDWLEAQTGPVDKSQVVETIQRGGIVVVEKELGNEPDDDAIQEKVYEIEEELRDQFYGSYETEWSVEQVPEEDLDGLDGPQWQLIANSDGRAGGEFYDSEDDAQAAADELNAEAENEAFYDWLEYQDTWEQARRALMDEGGTVQWKSYSLAEDSGHEDTYFEWLMRLPSGQGANPDSSPRTHWNDSGVVIHVRGHRRDGADGKRILFLDEIQSDWHQQAASRFTEAKAEAVRAFRSAQRGGDTFFNVPDELLQSIGDAIDEGKSHRAWPDIAKWLEANPSEAGAALLQSVADANRGYRAPPNPEKVAEAEGALDEARSEFDAKMAQLTEAIVAFGEKYGVKIEGGALSTQFPDSNVRFLRGKLETLERTEWVALGLMRNEPDVSPEALRAQARRAYEINADLSTLVLATNDRVTIGLVDRVNEAANLLAELEGKPVGTVSGEFAGESEKSGGGLALRDLFAATDKAKRDVELRARELDVVKNSRGIPDAPFKDTWPIVAVKRMIAKAAAEGYDQIAWIKQGENNGGMDDDVDWFYGRNLPNMVNKLLKPYKGKVKGVFVDGLERPETPQSLAFDAVLEEMRQHGVTVALGMSDGALEQAFDEAEEMFDRRLRGNQRQLAEIVRNDESVSEVARYEARINNDKIAKEEFQADRAGLKARYLAAQEAYIPGLMALDERVRELSAQVVDLRSKADFMQRYTGDEAGAREVYDDAIRKANARLLSFDSNIEFHERVIAAVRAAQAAGEETAAVEGLTYPVTADDARITSEENSIARLRREKAEFQQMFDQVSAFEIAYPASLELPAASRELAALQKQRQRMFELPTNLGFDITPELREAAASGFPLFQPDHRNMPRGRILFPGNDDQGAVIELFQGRDLSTLIHESSHLWLEELKADAADPNAPEQIKRDWQTLLDWFKANGYEVRNGVIPAGAHEMFARTGERYMREGKAPSVGLKRAFETFRSWLVSLYKTVRGLNSPITPEIREVFDRLLATDEEIAEARQMQGMDALFNTAVEAGMSPDEFANYQEQVASARAEAQGKVIEKVMADIAKRETRLGRERRRQIKDQVTKAAEDVPLFKALALLREERMDRAALVERFGEDVVGQLPSRVPPLYAEAGVDPEVIAERAGFASAEDMVNAMIAAEADQKAAKAGGDKRNMKARFIDQMTDQAFAAQLAVAP